jgi:hypothetical protein
MVQVAFRKVMSVEGKSRYCWFRVTSRPSAPPLRTHTSLHKASFKVWVVAVWVVELPLLS